MHACYLVLTDHCKFAIGFRLPAAYHIQFLNDNVTELIHFKYYFVLLNQFCELEISFSLLVHVSVWLLSTPAVKKAPALKAIDYATTYAVFIAYHIAKFNALCRA